MCSGLSSTKQKRGYRSCYLHGGRDLRRQKQNVDLQCQGEYVECKKTLSAGISPIECSACPNLSRAV